MEVQLTAEEWVAELDGVLIYREQEHSFDFEPGSPAHLEERTGGAGVTSASIGTLQIEIGVATGILLFVWGLHSGAPWQDGRLGIPTLRPGIVRLSDPSFLKPGVGISFAGVGGWQTTYDHRTGWICISPEFPVHHAATLIAAGTAIGLRNGHLGSIWLHPIFE